MNKKFTDNIKKKNRKSVTSKAVQVKRKKVLDTNFLFNKIAFF